MVYYLITKSISLKKIKEIEQKYESPAKKFSSDFTLSYIIITTKMIAINNYNKYPSIINLRSQQEKTYISSQTTAADVFVGNIAGLYVDANMTRGTGGAAGFGKIFITEHNMDSFYEAFCLM